jgi:hypothetical protein
MWGIILGMALAALSVLAGLVVRDYYGLWRTSPLARLLAR